MRACKVCRGPLIHLGSMGTRVYCRCRDCGIDQSYKKQARRRASLSQYDSRSRLQQREI